MVRYVTIEVENWLKPMQVFKTVHVTVYRYVDIGMKRDWTDKTKEWWSRF
jgi:hypothetical protein